MAGYVLSIIACSNGSFCISIIKSRNGSLCMYAGISPYVCL